jgi:hypothetical protein
VKSKDRRETSNISRSVDVELVIMEGNILIIWTGAERGWIHNTASMLLKSRLQETAVCWKSKIVPTLRTCLPATPTPTQSKGQREPGFGSNVLSGQKPKRSSKRVTTPAEKRFYAIYKPGFSRSGKIFRKYGRAGGTVEEISKQKFQKSIARVHDGGEIPTKSKKVYTLNRQRGQVHPKSMKEAIPQLKKDEGYRLVPAEEVIFSCITHKTLEFRVKLYQWGRVDGSGTPKHPSLRNRSKRLVNILGEEVKKDKLSALEVPLKHDTLNKQCRE